MTNMIGVGPFITIPLLMTALGRPQAMLGWIFVFATTQLAVILFGVGVLALGCLVLLLWSVNTKRWPFGLAEASS